MLKTPLRRDASRREYITSLGDDVRSGAKVRIGGKDAILLYEHPQNFVIKVCGETTLELSCVVK
jgi:hypothetical protein